jgi:predicted O-methyltransferase YrrM
MTTPASAIAPAQLDQLIDDLFARADRDFIRSAISREEGSLLRDLASRPSVRTTIEIGCANGISGLYICSGLSGKKGVSHTAIDPFQTRDFGNRGVESIRRAGFSFFTLLDKPSEIALPELLSAGVKADLAFIDGLHTADQTMVDFYYVDRLLSVGGFVVFDDVNSAAVSKIAHYAWTYPNYRLLAVRGKRGIRRRIINIVKQTAALALIPARWLFGDVLAREFVDFSLVFPETLWNLGFHTMAAFQKIGEAQRDTNWYRGI